MYTNKKEKMKFMIEASFDNSNNLAVQTGTAGDNFIQKDFFEQFSYCIKYDTTTDAQNRAEILGQMAPEIRKHIEKHGSRSTLFKMYDLLKNIGHLPSNIYVYDLLNQEHNMEYISGDCCTFDPQLAKMKRKKISTAIVNEYICRNQENAIFAHAQQIIQHLVYMLLNETPNCLRKLSKKGATNEDYATFLEDLFNKLVKKYHIQGHPSGIVKVIDSWDKATFYNYAKMPCCGDSIFIDDRDVTLDLVYQNEQERPEIGLYYFYICTENFANCVPEEKLTRIISAFLHAFVHFIDFIHPTKGALGPQVMDWYNNASPSMNRFDKVSSPVERNANYAENFFIQFMNKFSISK